MKKLLILFLLLAFINISNLKLEETTYDLILNASISRYGGEEAGLKSTFALDTNCSKLEGILDPTEIKKNNYNLKLIGNDSTLFNIICHFFIPTNPFYYTLKLICDFVDDPKGYNQSIKLEESIIDINSKKIKIFSTYLNLKFTDKNIPFLYSDIQTIDYNDGNDTYILKFKTGSYYDTNLFIASRSYATAFDQPLDDCKFENGEIICSLSRKTIEACFNNDDKYHQDTYYQIHSFGSEYGERYYENVYSIILKYVREKPKEDIYIEVLHTFDKALRFCELIFYETNITNFPYLNTLPFYLNITHKEINETFYHSCSLKKNEDDTPLLLICKINIGFNELNVSLNTFNKLNISDINLNYNFIISYSQKEYIYIDFETFGYFYGFYPKILDYTSKDSLNLTFKSNTQNIAKIFLNQNSANLKCERNDFIYRCIVPKSHFIGDKSEYYYVYHAAFYWKKKVKNYELSPIKVIGLDSKYSNSNEIVTPFIVVSFLCLILILV